MAEYVMDNDMYFSMLETLINEGRPMEMTPKGSSMLPFIRGGRDSVVLERLERSPEVGDIVLAKVGDRFIMHRVISSEGGNLTLMGDGNVRGTESCTIDDVIGTVIEIHREGGRTVRPGKARFWRFLRPLRRYILAFYRRVIL